ncbi:hypothetical protein K470DRAFT_258004 [Piedraia hortae CBS 480.64]|uniref:Uncharacterized protein n=1 Tax=Piedraia hortae CBS 480.64 TaxID=1314780 RepID=A0A6A7BYV4_9PEZI|nr:hypothetical protein K470DRAFT_258004 [Piedraia hortae CBS 480.64]
MLTSSAARTAAATYFEIALPCTNSLLLSAVAFCNQSKVLALIEERPAFLTCSRVTLDSHCSSAFPDPGLSVVPPSLLHFLTFNAFCKPSQK